MAQQNRTDGYVELGEPAQDCYFADRGEAGRKLAQRLVRLKGGECVVLGLARGGVIVAAEVARELECPLDVLIVRKVGAPFQPEYGIGAVAPGGVRVSDAAALASLGISEAEFDRLAEREEEEVDRRLQLYRRAAPPAALEGKTAILVDDGLATGVTAVAAVRYARQVGASRVVMAVPVCSRQGEELLAEVADEVTCLCLPQRFHAVGQWYSDFAQTTDEEVIGALTSLRGA